MALTFDGRCLPQCCGVGLVPGEPHTQCPRCFARYDTALLAQGIGKMRNGDTAVLTPGYARLHSRAARAM